jgi:hypothetical protein
VLAEHLLHDLRDRLLLEDATVGAAAQEPEPRAQDEPIEVEITDPPHAGQPGHVTVEEALTASGQVDRDGHVRAEGIRHRDGRRRAQDIHGVLEQAIHHLVARQRSKEQLLPRQGGDQDRSKGGHVTIPFVWCSERSNDRTLFGAGSAAAAHASHRRRA